MRSSFKLFLVTTLVIFIPLALSAIWNRPIRQDTEFSFSVMGDVPRNEEEKIILNNQILSHNAESSAKFMIHVGDIKSGSDPCDEQSYTDVAAQLLKLNVPTFIVPGDNEWNDCQEPDKAWQFWVSTFLNFEQQWNIEWEVIHQPEQKENLVFLYHDVLFIGINLVGGRIHDQTQWDEKISNDLDWLKFCLNNIESGAAVVFAQANPDEKHTGFVNGFKALARNYSKQILFIHGDGHKWLYENPWLVPNMIRVQVDKGGIADPLQVTISRSKPKLFEFERDVFN